MLKSAYFSTLCFFCVFGADGLRDSQGTGDNALFAPPLVDRRQIKESVIDYPSETLLGGNKKKTSNAAAVYVSGDPQPFQFWDVSHISGPSVFDCPDGFTLVDNTCILMEYKPAEESCPYGSYRQKDSKCIQIDSVPPERTCPAGFAYFMKGCIRRTRVAATLTCSPGYTQIDDACFSVSTVSAKVSCPNGFQLESKGTTGTHVCVKRSITPPKWKCQEGYQQNHTSCFKLGAVPPLKVCPEGFQLSMSKMPQNKPSKSYCVKGVLYEGSLLCPDGYTLTWPPVNELGTMEAAELDLYYHARCLHEGGKAVIRDTYSVTPNKESSILTGSKAVDKTFSFDSLLSGYEIPVVVRKSSKPTRKKSGLRTLSSRMLSDFVSDSRWQLPDVVFDRAACNHVNLSTLHWFETGATDLPQVLKGEYGLETSVTELVPSQMRRVSGALQLTRTYTPYCAEIQRIPYKLACPAESQLVCISGEMVDENLLKCMDENPSSTKSTSFNLQCQNTVSSLPAIPYCEPPFALESDTSPLTKEVKFHPDGPICAHYETTDPVRICPFGVGKGNDTSNGKFSDGSCEVLFGEPIEVSCPTGYHRGTQEISNNEGKGQRGSAHHSHSKPGVEFCELVEYADYQVTCPGGYRRDRALNNNAACLAKKVVPSSILCAPGFVPSHGDIVTANNAKACMKKVIVAPTVVSYPSESVPVSSEVVDGAAATACIFTKNGMLSCGMERKYFGETDFARQTQVGSFWKEK